MNTTLTFTATSAAHAKEIIDRVNGEVHITDDMIRDYLVRKGWWKPGVEDGPRKSDVIPLRGGTPASLADKLDGDKPINDKQERELKTRANVSPGTPTITKIGSTAKDYILNELKGTGVPRTDLYFGAKYSEHLRLLWKRGEIKFDGTEYYL